MRPEDDFTTTVDAAEAFERAHSIEPWDGRPRWFTGDVWLDLSDVVDPDGWFPGKAGQ